MPISITRICKPATRGAVDTGLDGVMMAHQGEGRKLGFTLIELLIVVAILAVLAALIAPNIGAERRVGLQTEAERLARSIELARIAAVSQNRQWGLRILSDGYAFEHYESERKRWQRDESTPFESRQLPEDIDLSVKIESRSVQFPEGRKSPSILILSSGEITPFSIELFSLSADNSCTVNSDGMARTGYACA